MAIKYAIGVDLGTYSSCAGVQRHKNVEIIYNDLGNRTTPSFVDFKLDEIIIGELPMGHWVTHPDNIVYESKRLIGRKFEDVYVQEEREKWTFQLENADGKPRIIVEHKSQEMSFSPEEISAMILRELKKNAETYTNTEVKDAVLSVPAHFNTSQRAATKAAGNLAGLNVLGIIDEPIAAAIAYELDKKQGPINALIFNMGLKTLEVSILSIQNGAFEIKVVVNKNIGGSDFDRRLADHFISEFETKENKDICANGGALRRILSSCEETKRFLNYNNAIPFQIPYLFEDISFRTNITRDKFEDLCSDLFEDIWLTLENALSDAKMDQSSINEIILVGGSTKIPKIQNLLLSFFNGQKLNCSIYPNQVVAYGASIKAGALLDGRNRNYICFFMSIMTVLFAYYVYMLIF